MPRTSLFDKLLFAGIVLYAAGVFAGVGNVNYNTGNVEFSQTLLTASGRKISFPVNLTYSSNIKRSHLKGEGSAAPQLASWVGLGFDLDMPYIERKIVGGPDNQSGISGQNANAQYTAFSTSLMPAVTNGSEFVYNLYNYARLFDNYSVRLDRRKKWIPLAECRNGYLYYIHARNSNAGIFTAEQNGFVISRDKLGRNYLFTEFHWDTGEPFGTVKPLKEIEKAPEFKDDDEKLQWLNAKRVRRMRL